MIRYIGGHSKVEFSATNTFPGTEIPRIMKGSKIEFKTPTEEDAMGKNVSAGKQVTGTIISQDLTDTPFATLRGYEAAQTEINLKFYGLSTGQYLQLKYVQVIVELQPAEVGKNWARLVHFSGFADSETNLMLLNLS